MHLDRLVDNPLGHARNGDLDGLDLGVRALVADGIHQPGSLQHQQPRLLDPDPGLSDPVLDHALVGDRPAPGYPADRTAAERLEGPFGRADLAHAGMDPARPEPGLGYGEAISI